MDLNTNAENQVDGTYSSDITFFTKDVKALSHTIFEKSLELFKNIRECEEKQTYSTHELMIFKNSKRTRYQLRPYNRKPVSLHLALTPDHKNAVQYLVKSRKPLNYDENLLNPTSNREYPDIMNMLFQTELDKNRINVNPSFPLQLSFMKDNISIGTLLLKTDTKNTLSLGNFEKYPIEYTNTKLNELQSTASTSKFGIAKEDFNKDNSQLIGYLESQKENKNKNNGFNPFCTQLSVMYSPKRWNDDLKESLIQLNSLNINE